MNSNLTVNGFTGNIDLIQLLPTAAILISAIIYYFGVRWGETHVDEYNVASNYFAGILFIINFMLVPYVIVRIIGLIIDPIIEEYTSHLSVFKSEVNSFSDFIPYLLILFVEFLILWLVRSNTEKFEEMRKSPDEFEEIDYKKVKARKWLWLREWLLQKSIPSLVIFIIYELYKFNESSKLSIIFLILPSFLIAFLTFTNLVFCAGYCEAHYPMGNIYCKDKKITKGIILKHGKYVFLLTENKKCLINRDDICHIEESENSKKLCRKYYPVEPILDRFEKTKKNLERLFKNNFK